MAMTSTTFREHLRLTMGTALAVIVFGCVSDGGGCGANLGGTDAADTDTADTGTMDAGVPGDRCAVIQASINDAGFGAKVTVTCDEEYAYIGADTYPDHELMTGIVGSNEQIPVPAKGYASPVRLEPVIATSLTARDAALGVAVNGVPIYDYSAAGDLDLDQYDPNVDTVLLEQLDNCGGHAGRGDDYHYHAAPTCMIDVMPNTGDDAILGWGFDGYPIYGDRNPDGSPITPDTLDVCNGQSDETFGFRYHTSQAPPYIVQCLVGEVDTQDPNFLPRVPPLVDAMNQGKPPGMPPGGGVDNLVHVVQGDTRTMSYEHQGSAYYISYSPAAEPDCYTFEFKTVTNGGVVEQGVYCR